MTALNTSTARVINPILTGIAQSYRHVQRVGHVRFPIVNVLQRGGKVIESGYGGNLVLCRSSRWILQFQPRGIFGSEPRTGAAARPEPVPGGRIPPFPIMKRSHSRRSKRSPNRENLILCGRRG